MLEALLLNYGCIMAALWLHCCWPLSIESDWLSAVAVMMMVVGVYSTTPPHPPFVVVSKRSRLRIRVEFRRFAVHFWLVDAVASDFGFNERLL